MFLIISLILELEIVFSEKRKKYLHELSEKWDLEYLEINEDFNDGLKNNVGDEGMQNLNMDG